jgi:hypothetical protein
MKVRFWDGIIVDMAMGAERSNLRFGQSRNQGDAGMVQ